MYGLKNEWLRELRMQYPEGTRLELLYMEDLYAIPVGAVGAVNIVDDIGSIHMKWENGRELALIPGVDKFRKV